MQHILRARGQFYVLKLVIYLYDLLNYLQFSKEVISLHLFSPSLLLKTTNLTMCSFKFSYFLESNFCTPFSDRLLFEACSHVLFLNKLYNHAHYQIPFSLLFQALNLHPIFFLITMSKLLWGIPFGTFKLGAFFFLISYYHL